MMCFREGCDGGVDGHGSVEVIVVIGTRGSIGTSEARITLKFCSLLCARLFLIEHPSQGDILDKVVRLRAISER